MEEALSESEEKYRTLFDNAEVGMYRSRLDGSGIIALNQRLADLFGFTKEEMLASPATIRWADPSAREEMVRLVREHGELRDHEIDIVTKGGEVRTTLASIKLYPREGYLEGTAVDITDRKRAEEALRESERRYRTLAESLPHLVWTCRADGPCDYLSPRWVDYTGIPEADQLGYGWLEQLHPDDRERVVAEWSEVAPRGGVFDIEFRIRRADGVHRWFKTRAIPFRDDGGRVVKWFGSNTDIDDHKRAHEALRESEERHPRHPLQHRRRRDLDRRRRPRHPDEPRRRGAHRLDRGRGVGQARWRRSSASSTRRPGPRSRARSTRVLREGMVVGLANHTLLIAKDGTERPIADSGAPIRDEKGEITGVVLVFRDQTENARRRRHWRRGRSVSPHLYENVNEVIFYLDVEGEDRYRFHSVNPAFLKATGLQTGQVAGKLVGEVIPEPSLSVVLSNYRTVIQDGESVRWEEVTPYPSGNKSET